MSVNPEHLKLKIGKWIELEASGRMAIVTGTMLEFCILIVAVLL